MTRELYSTTCPGSGSRPGSTISLPVGMIATRGWRRTATASTPAASSAPTS